MAETPTTNRLSTGTTTPGGRGCWVLTDAAYRMLGWPPPGKADPLATGTMSPMTDLGISGAHDRVDLLLDECLLVLYREGYYVSDAATEVADRLHPAMARVRARIVHDTDVARTHAAREAGA